MCVLHWDNIYLNERKIIVKHSVSRIIEDGKSVTILNTPKTEQSLRMIPINQQLYDCLVQIDNKKGYVLTGDEKYMDDRTYRYYFRKVNGFRFASL